MERMNIKIKILFITGFFLLALSSCVRYAEHGRGKDYHMGVASWYGKDFHGKLTANGEIYNMHKLTAAHKYVPLGTQAMVENLSNGKRVKVKINDRGPFVKGRIIDLSYAAAKKIGMVGNGTAKVKVTFIGNYDRSKVHQKLKYYIQTGSFTEKDSAETMKDDLTSLNHISFINKANVSGKTYYRVCVGPLENDLKIMTTKNNLTKQGYKPLVTTNTCAQ